MLTNKECWLGKGFLINLHSTAKRGNWSGCELHKKDGHPIIIPHKAQLLTMLPQSEKEKNYKNNYVLSEIYWKDNIWNEKSRIQLLKSPNYFNENKIVCLNVQVGDHGAC